MRILNFELWKYRGSVKATFSWEHEDFEFFEWRIICPEFGQVQVVSPRIKILTRDGTIFRNTVHVPKRLMQEVTRIVLERYHFERKNEVPARSPAQIKPDPNSFQSTS